MKRYSLLVATLMAMAIFVVYGGVAFALTASHQAGMTGSSQGDCAACHIPHKAQGAKRLFPNVVPPGTMADWGFMGSMCAEYCHNQAGSFPNALLNETALFNVGDPSIEGSHGLNLKTAANPPSTIVATTLPYGDGGRGLNANGTEGFECTTCHDTHRNAPGDSSNALVRLDIDALCDECHTDRGQGDGTWVGYGDANDVGGLGTNSSHPVGLNVTGDSDVPANSNIFIGLAIAPGGSALDAEYNNVGGVAPNGIQHNLGGHLINGVLKDNATPAVGCITCHSVHGVQTDGQAVSDSPNEDLLSIRQSAQGSVEPDLSANGGEGLDTANYLCGYCHAYTSASADDWDPGATAFSHPANGQAATNDMGDLVLAGALATAPYGSNPAPPNFDIAVLCETCHKPHGATVNSHILRADELALCQICHVAAPLNHHPSGVAMVDMCDSNIDAAPVGTLDCADCHSGNGAHNWIGAGMVGLNPNWEPVQNGRPDAICDSQVNTSKECIDCHLCLETTPRNSPTNHNGNASTSPDTADHLQNRGDGSHYLGDTAIVWANGLIDAGAFNACTDVWPNTNGSGAPGWTRTSQGTGGPGTQAVVCESCHELEFDKNEPGTALLLFNYHEQALDQPQSNFCTGCHGITPSGDKTHPLTGQTITRQEDSPKIGRPAGVTLITDLAGFADQTAPGNAPNNAEYPATVDRVNCDSCHQPHDTETVGGTYILEFGATGGGGGRANVVVSGDTLVSHRSSGSSNIDHATLCTQCHNY